MLLNSFKHACLDYEEYGVDVINNFDALVEQYFVTSSSTSFDEDSAFISLALIARSAEVGGLSKNQIQNRLDRTVETLKTSKSWPKIETWLHDELAPVLLKRYGISIEKSQSKTQTISQTFALKQSAKINYFMYKIISSKDLVLHRKYSNELLQIFGCSDIRWSEDISQETMLESVYMDTQADQSDIKIKRNCSQNETYSFSIADSNFIVALRVHKDAISAMLPFIGSILRSSPSE